MQALRAGKRKSVVKILYISTASAKYLSPLDNTLWHSFKQQIRNRHLLVAADIPLLLPQTFYSLSRKKISNAHRKCSITYESDEYYDRL
ncbi:unnamed protein product [Rotaria sordida]|uniref:Uncharacterized protein n=1 Tax=Rotaria sordida TaxID=392033 RepID=A0A819N0L0_9BILA|nr:unnamed protein product [Rotaria sordida]CAF0928584.1 unnamed protein product [Rotaria sordida]CAF0947166.1 unnamed protein product [Rotaria sordida]CAF3989504.1 unnamed protein product [Rotaria sordida]CAF4002700.1 unnamed protein product [Rotaria sordida]